MKKLLLSILLIFFMNFYGCAPLIKALVSKAPEAETVDLHEVYRTKALECQLNWEMQMALFYWKIVESVNPLDKEAGKKITDLKAAITLEAETHFKNGLIYYNDKDFEAAREEFIGVLRYNPEHGGALDYLKNRLSGENYEVYNVMEGDTFKDIAQKVYKDPTKDFLIAYFVGIGSTSKPEPGLTIKLPVLEEKHLRPAINIPKEIAIARNFFSAQNYEKVLLTIHNILKHDPANKEASDLTNATYYQLGKRLSQQHEDLEALKMFKKADPDYKDIKEAMADLTERLKNRAESHYKKGVKHFLNEELKKAITEWEKALILNPEHEKSKEDIKNAKSLLEKLKEVK